MNAKNLRRQRRNKDLIFAHYGEACACCGEAEREFLTIDHINNDGGAHRRELGSKNYAGTAFYEWIVKNDMPDSLQILCWNCNHSKHRGKGVCIHQRG